MQSKPSGTEGMPDVGEGITEGMVNLRRLSAGNEFEPGFGRMPWTFLVKGGSKWGKKKRRPGEGQVPKSTQCKLSSEGRIAFKKCLLSSNSICQCHSRD